jgi:hypothetical protein
MPSLYDPRVNKTAKLDHDGRTRDERQDQFPIVAWP